MKTYKVTEYNRASAANITTEVVASSQQAAANLYFAVERAIKPMAASKGSWANHRHSKHNPSRTVTIVSA
jgi:hypothetical protein